VRLARQNGFYTMVGSVATRALVADGLLAALHGLARECGADELRLVEPMPCGLLADGGGDSLLEPGHIAAIRQFHVQANRKQLRPKVCAFNQIESPELFGCGAGTQHLFIDATGEVCPCDFTAMSFGNAASQPLDVIWSRMSEAMGNPRRHCFIQAHHRLLLKHGGFPLPPDKSCLVCAEAGREPLPDYFQLVAGRKE